MTLYNNFRTIVVNALYIYAYSYIVSMYCTLLILYLSFGITNHLTLKLIHMGFRGCGCIGFMSPMHRNIPDFYWKRVRGNPRNLVSRLNRTVWEEHEVTC